MVRYLVEEERLDVNQMDTDVQFPVLTQRQFCVR